MKEIKPKVEEMPKVDDADQKKAQAFLDDYKILSKKHGIDFQCQLQYTKGGISPLMVMIKLDESVK
jgi:hypothetical protein